jgi:hypothetical protein
MRQTPDTTLMQSAAQKMETGAFLTMAEVCALMDVTPSVVHKLPLPSFRVGRSLRFDPADVGRLLGTLKEPAILLDPQSMSAMFFGAKYYEESDGAFGYLVCTAPTMQRIEWNDVIEALLAGKTVTITPPDPFALAFAEVNLEQFKVNQAKKHSGETQASEE